MHEEILSKLDGCKAMLNEIRTSIAKDEGESKSKVIYMARYALILYYFAFEHIPASGID